MTALVIMFVGLAVALGIAALFVKHLIEERHVLTDGRPRTFWEAAVAASYDSATHLWSGVNLIAGGATIAATYGAIYFQDPELSTAIKGILDPKWIGFFVVIIASVNVWARSRTKPPG